MHLRIGRARADDPPRQIREQLVSSAADTERRWRERYIPSQQLYFATAHPADQADIVHNDDVQRPSFET